MRTTLRGSGPTRRIAIAALAATALPVGAGLVCLAPAAAAAPAAGSASPTSSAAAPGAVGSSSAPGLYAAVTSRGSTRSLHLVDRRTGRVQRTVATVPASDIVEPFADVDVAPDGSVWAVVRTVRQGAYLPYATVLKHYVGRRSVDVLRYATSVRLSPDGRQLAVTVLSPDGDGDGKGSESLRIVTTSGKVLRTLSTLKFPVDAQGNPTLEVGGQHVSGWLTPRTLIVGNGCCDSGSVSLVPAGKASAPNTWPTYDGDGSTQAIGTIGTGTVLIGARLEVGDGVKVPIQTVGVQALTMTATRPRGRQLFIVRDDRGDLGAHVDAFVARAKAAPLVIGTKRFPYKGSGRVVAAYL